MDIFGKLREINFPLGEYIIVGGLMQVIGIRESNDIDIVATPELFAKLIKQGWQICDCEKCQASERKVLKGASVDVYSNLHVGEYNEDTRAMIARAEIINGYPFLPLQELIKLKTAIGRPKDFRDIEMINKYLRAYENSRH